MTIYMPSWRTHKSDIALRKACKQLCRNVLDLFKLDLGCLKYYELEIAFQADAKPVFCKPWTLHSPF